MSFFPPDPSPRAVTVVVPTWNGHERVRRCLESLVDPALREVIVVDNGSEAPIHLSDTAWPRGRVLRMPQNQGFAAGCNAGIHVATSPFVAILNDDARAGPRTFTKLVEHCERQARVGFVGPRSNYVKGRQCWTDTAGLDVEDVEAIEARFEARFAKRCEDVSYLAGLCLLARRTTWLALDGFDDAFGLGNFEDDDLCLRSRLAGQRLLVAHDAYVWHEGSATFGESGIDYSALMRKQRELFLQRWRESPLAHAEVASFYDQHNDVLERAHELRGLDGHARAWAAAPLARAHESVGANDAAAAEWARVLRLAPCHVEAWSATALHALAGDEDCKADELFAFIEAELPMDRLERARLDTERARLHAMRRRPADDTRADALLDHALTCVADYLPAREVSAALALARGDLRAAHAALEALADSQNPDVLHNLAVARQLCGDLVGSLEARERAQSAATR